MTTYLSMADRIITGEPLNDGLATLQAKTPRKQSVAEKIQDGLIALWTEDAIESLTAVRKVRPARGAFGDWNVYDADGDPLVTTYAAAQAAVANESGNDGDNDDLVADYVNCTTVGYDPIVTVNTVEGTRTVRTARYVERPDWNATVGDWLVGSLGSEVEGKYLSADPYRGTYDDAALAGYSHTDGHYGPEVTCWFCNDTVTYREFALSTKSDGNLLGATSQARAFVTEMLLHNAAHRANGDTVWINSTIKNRGWAPKVFTFQPRR